MTSFFITQGREKEVINFGNKGLVEKTERVGCFTRHHLLVKRQDAGIVAVLLQVGDFTVILTESMDMLLKNYFGFIYLDIYWDVRDLPPLPPMTCRVASPG